MNLPLLLAFFLSYFFCGLPGPCRRKANQIKDWPHFKKQTKKKKLVQTLIDGVLFYQMSIIVSDECIYFCDPVLLAARDEASAGSFSFWFVCSVCFQDYKLKITKQP